MSTSLDAWRLERTARQLVAPGKGILAADESTRTMTARLRALGIASTARTRRDYREVLVRTPGLARRVSGVILCDETFRQKASSGLPFPEELAARGVLPGIKVDLGVEPLAGCAGESVTTGLDRLRDRLERYEADGARFAKWRAVFTIGPQTPSVACITANVHALGRYAAMCQEAGVVPIVEPEVLMEGNHGIARCADVTENVLRALFAALGEQCVVLEGIVLKPNMVLPGLASAETLDVQGAALVTLRCLRRSVPPAVPGIAFLSGGQGAARATAHLRAMTDSGPHPWRLTYSFGRALQDDVLAAWAGDPARVDAGRHALLSRLRDNGAAISRAAADPQPVT